MKNIERRIRNDRDRDLRQARARELRRKRRHASSGCNLTKILALNSLLLQIIAAVVLAVIVRCI